MNKLGPLSIYFVIVKLPNNTLKCYADYLEINDNFTQFLFEIQKQGTVIEKIFMTEEQIMLEGYTPTSLLKTFISVALFLESISKLKIAVESTEINNGMKCAAG